MEKQVLFLILVFFIVSKTYGYLIECDKPDDCFEMIKEEPLFPNDFISNEIYPSYGVNPAEKPFQSLEYEKYRQFVKRGSLKDSLRLGKKDSMFNTLRLGKRPSEKRIFPGDSLRLGKRDKVEEDTMLVEYPDMKKSLYKNKRRYYRLGDDGMAFNLPYQDRTDSFHNPEIKNQPNFNKYFKDLISLAIMNKRKLLFDSMRLGKRSGTSSPDWETLNVVCRNNFREYVFHLTNLNGIVHLAKALDQIRDKAEVHCNQLLGLTSDDSLLSTMRLG